MPHKTTLMRELRTRACSTASERIPKNRPDRSGGFLHACTPCPAYSAGVVSALRSASIGGRGVRAEDLRRSSRIISSRAVAMRRIWSWCHRYRPDQTADDDVFLQALQAVGLAGDRRFRQHLGRFLEGRGRDEGRGLQRGLGDAEQDRLAVGRLLALFNQLIVDIFQFDPSTLSHDVGRVTGIGDFDLLQHLANDHLDVLVVDDNALQAVDFLDLVDEVGGQSLHALDRQDVVRRRVTVEDVVTLSI